MAAKFQIKEIRVANLSINTANPRFNKVPSQRDAIDIMVSEQKEKIFNLASDIVEAGLNPSELIVVTPAESGRFRVLEGNRRVVSLKLLNNPVPIREKHKALFNRFKTLGQKFKKNPARKVLCAVFKNEIDATRWIRLKHTGENEGKGTVRWDTAQISRFESSMGEKPSIGLQAIDFISKAVDEETAKKFKKASITNLERLLTDKNVQEVIGIRINKGVIETDLLKEEGLRECHFGN